MQRITHGISSEFFDYLIEYWEQCSIYFLELVNSVSFNRILKQLFALVDTTHVSLACSSSVSQHFNANYSFLFLVRLAC